MYFAGSATKQPTSDVELAMDRAWRKYAEDLNAKRTSRNSQR